MYSTCMSVAGYPRQLDTPGKNLSPPTLLIGQHKFSGQSIHHKWMCKQSSDFPCICSIANVSDTDSVNRRNMAFLLNFIQTTGIMGKLYIVHN